MNQLILSKFKSLINFHTGGRHYAVDCVTHLYRRPVAQGQAQGRGAWSGYSSPADLLRQQLKYSVILPQKPVDIKPKCPKRRSKPSEEGSANIPCDARTTYQRSTATPSVSPNTTSEPMPARASRRHTVHNHCPHIPCLRCGAWRVLLCGNPSV